MRILIALLYAVAAFGQGALVPSVRYQPLDSNGKPVARAKLCTYLAGSSTPSVLYTDAALTIPTANPVVLDSSGRTPAFFLGERSYKFVLRTPGVDGTCSTGDVLWTHDNVSDLGQLLKHDLADRSYGAALIAFDPYDHATGRTLADLANPTYGDSLIMTQQVGTGAMPRTVRSKVNDIVSANDFEADDDGAATVTEAINAAIDSFGGAQGVIWIPASVGPGDPSVVNGNEAPENITLIDERGGLPVAVGLTFNGTTGTGGSSGDHTGMRLAHSATDPDRATIALEVWQYIRGDLPGGGASLEGFTAEAQTLGTLGTVDPTATMVGIEGVSLINSDGGTISRTRGGTFSVGTVAGKTTGITTAAAIVAQSGYYYGEKPVNAYGLIAEDPQAYGGGTSRAYSVWNQGKFLLGPEGNFANTDKIIDTIDSAGVITPLLRAVYTDKVIFSAVSDAQGISLRDRTGVEYLDLTTTARLYRPLVLSNASFVQFLDSAGDPQTVLAVDGSDNMVLASANETNGIIFRSPGGAIYYATMAPNLFTAYGNLAVNTGGITYTGITDTCTVTPTGITISGGLITAITGGTCAP